MSREQLEALSAALSKLLMEVELAYGDNPAGTYPSEVEMTLRLAFTATRRALFAYATEVPA